MSVQHKRTSIKNKPKTVEELTAQGAELERKVSELEQSGGGASRPCKRRSCPPG